MTKPFAVFDIDGTIFRSSLLIEVVESLIAKGIFPVKANSEIQPALIRWHDRATPDAYLDYLQEVILAFESNIRGVTENQLSIVSEDVIAHKLKQTYVFTRDLITQLRETHELFAISGSPIQLVERFASAHGFADFVATEYNSVDGVFDGTAEKAHSKKDVILDQLVKKHGLDYSGSIAVGDTKGDIELLNAVENPIAFNPDGFLRQTAEENGWQIVVERKSQIYSLEPKDGTYKLVEAKP